MDFHYALTGVIAILLAAVFFAAALGIGGLLLPQQVRGRVDRPLIEVAIGSGVLGYIALALGLAGLMRPGMLGAALALGCGALGWSFARRVPAEASPVQAPDADASPLLARGAGVAAALALAFAMLGAMLPEVEYDALWYHLTFPRRYLESGFLLDFPCDHMSPTPQHVELLYGYGLLFGDARSAKLIHFGFGVLAAAWAWTLAASTIGRRWAVVAAALFLTAPTVTWEMTTAYNELPLAFVATGAVVLLLDWRRSGARTLLVLAGVLLGFGLAGKHLAMFFLAPLALGALLVRLPAPRSVRTRVSDAALLSAVAVAVALPWYVRAWQLTGNPLFPMFYDQLTALGVEVQRWDAQAQQGWWSAMGRYGHGRGLRDLLLLPFRATWDGVRYAGSFGPTWLLGLPLLPLLWRRITTDMRLLALLVLVFIALWVSPWSSFQIRYLVPVAPIAAVLIAAVLRCFLELSREVGWPGIRRLMELGVVLTLIGNLPLFSRVHDARTGWIATTFHSINPGAWRTAIGAYDHQRYLRERLESYGAVRHINRVVPPTGRIVWFGEAAHFYARPELVMDFSRCIAAGTWAAPPGQEDAAFRFLRSEGVTHIAWDLTRRDVQDADFAIRSPAFLTRYTELVYEDDAIQLYRLRGISDDVPADRNDGAE